MNPSKTRSSCPKRIGLANGLNPLRWIGPLELCKTDVKNKNPYGTYRPDRQLPRDKNGNPIPDVNVPHTQLGTKPGRKGNYTQAGEWGYGENDNDNDNVVPKMIIDFTAHGRPNEHPNPHQHDYIPNPTGGTPQHGPAKDLEIP